jgi:hypothetical protein
MLITTLSFVTFVQNNPGMAAWIIGGLLSVILTLSGIYYKIIYQQLGELAETDKRLETRVSMVEIRLEKYEGHVGAGEQALSLLTRRIEKHMEEEEAQVWTGMKSLGDKLNEMQVENVEAHAKICNEYGARLTRIETKTEYIKNAMPNGELAEMLKLLRVLVKAQ